MTIEQRIADLGLTLPSPPLPVANYVPRKLVGSFLYLSGMIPVRSGEPFRRGKLGGSVSVEDGIECARICTLNALGWARQALGDLDRIHEVVRVRGFVACTPEFTDHPRVLNGCSDLLVDLLGDAGRHVRSAVGCPSLPLDVPVEIDFVFTTR